MRRSEVDRRSSKSVYIYRYVNLWKKLYADYLNIFSGMRKVLGSCVHVVQL